MKTTYISENNGSYYQNIFIISNYNFDELKAIYSIILELANGNINSWHLSQISELEKKCPNLTFVVGDNLGIVKNDRVYDVFTCSLTRSGYSNMAEILLNSIQNFVDGGYYWLYDLDSEIELLLSRGGNW